MTRHTHTLSALAAAAVLFACGGGGGSPETPAVPATYSGQFIDAPTKGLSYTASPSGLSGTTDATGAFSFKAGDTVTFSVGVGAGGSIAVGSWQPPAPAAGVNAVVFVESLPNGLQVAQILQSLNHGSAAAMDVSGLSLPAADVTNLNAYIASGGTALPAGVASDVALLGAVQADAGAQTFVVPGGASVGATLAGLQATLLGLTVTTGTTLSTLPGQVVFHQGSISGAGVTVPEFGIDDFKTDHTLTSIQANSGNTIQSGANYSTSNNILTISGGNVTSTITVSYIDTTQGLWTDSATDGTTGAGTYAFLQSSFAPSVIAGKTLTLVGSLGGCGGVPLQVVIDGPGSSYQSNCQGSAAGSNGVGAIAAVPSLPGIVTFTDATSGSIHYVGLVAGGTITRGSVAVVHANGNGGGYRSNGIFSITAQ